ncbi:MAG: hypothetical protein GY799_17635 [Desulfobulbaceae bacterium]|nr:hypothetical protein [Desulfobulbaceae bacterium]
MIQLQLFEVSDEEVGDKVMSNRFWNRQQEGKKNYQAALQQLKTTRSRETRC